MSESKIPNIIFSDGDTTIGFLETHQTSLTFMSRISTVSKIPAGLKPIKEQDICYI